LQNYIKETSLNITMAEAGMAAYGTVIGMGIVLSVIIFALRGKGHPEQLD